MAILWLFLIPLVSCGQIPISNQLTPEENTKLMDTCGGEMPSVMRAPSYKVFDGDQVKPHAYPFVVALYNKRTGGLCTGVLMSKRHVLTASHCVVEMPDNEKRAYYCKVHKTIRSWIRIRPKESFTIYAGSRCPQPGPCTPRRTEYYVSKIFDHPYFNGCNEENDLAVVELSRDVDESDAIPICLPKPSTLLPEEVKVIGYGIDPLDENAYSPGLQVTSLFGCREEKGVIRARGTSTSICSGDSGGPLFCSSNGRFTILGITFMGTTCAVYGLPNHGEKTSSFVDVREHLIWICHISGVCSLS